jgi:hypothetical protein
MAADKSSESSGKNIAKLNMKLFHTSAQTVVVQTWQGWVFTCYFTYFIFTYQV